MRKTVCEHCYVYIFDFTAMVKGEEISTKWTASEKIARIIQQSSDVLQSPALLTELSMEGRVEDHYIHSTPRNKISLGRRDRESYASVLEGSSCCENVFETSGGSRKSQTAFLAWNSPEGNSISRYPPSLPPEKLVNVPQL